MVAARIFAILAPDMPHVKDSAVIVLLEHYEVSERRDPRLNMPILTDKNQSLAVSPGVSMFSTLLCLVNFLPVKHIHLEYSFHI